MATICRLQRLSDPYDVMVYFGAEDVARSSTKSETVQQTRLAARVEVEERFNSGQSVTVKRAAAD